MLWAYRDCFGHIGIALGIQKILCGYRKFFGVIGNSLGTQELLRTGWKSALGGERPSSAASPVCGRFRWRETPAVPAALLGTVGTKQMAVAAQLMGCDKKESHTAARVFWPASKGLPIK